MEASAQICVGHYSNKEVYREHPHARNNDADLFGPSGLHGGLSDRARRCVVNGLEDCECATLKFDHPRNGVWKIVGPAKEPGFWNLISVVFVNESWALPPYRSTFHLCLHESEFDRLP